VKRAERKVGIEASARCD